MAESSKNEPSKPSEITTIAMFLIAAAISYRYWQVIVNRPENQPRVFQALPATAPATATTTSKPAETNPVTSPSSAAPATQLARVMISADDGTPELQTLFLQSKFTDSQRTALGLYTLAAGTDLYAVRVRIENTGTIPVRIYPRNIRMHHGKQAVAAYTIEHPSFLQSSVVQPNQYLTGLVVYRATLDVGTGIRARGEGSYSYEDPSVLVSYGRGSR